MKVVTTLPCGLYRGHQIAWIQKNKHQSVTITYRQPSVWTQNLAWRIYGRPGLANLQNQYNFHHRGMRALAPARKTVLISPIPFLCLFPADLCQSSKARHQFHQPWKKHLLLRVVQPTKHCNTAIILQVQLSQNISCFADNWSYKTANVTQTLQLHPVCHKLRTSRLIWHTNTHTVN